MNHSKDAASFHPSSITRRQAFHRFAATNLCADVSQQFVARDPHVPKAASTPALPKPALPVCSEYGWLRAPGMGPSWAASIDWSLREGLATSTRRERSANHGVSGQGFHPFFTKDGRLRGGLEVLSGNPARRAPWKM